MLNSHWRRDKSSLYIMPYQIGNFLEVFCVTRFHVHSKAWAQDLAIWKREHIEMIDCTKANASENGINAGRW